MNLNATDLEELNELLSDVKINIPDFRRTVSHTGNNYLWLHRNIMMRNPNITTRLKDLLNLTASKT